MNMQSAFAPIAQGLAVSALNQGLADCLERVGLARERLVRASELTNASESLSPREVGALAYAQGLSGADAAYLAFGSGRTFSLRPSSDRISRLAVAKTAWWSDPITRVGDLGTGATKQLIGATLGLDLNRMDNSEPLPVPADTRFAALAKLILGEHWSLGVGVRDDEWIGTLNQSHKDIAARFLITKDELADAEEARDLYHHVPVPVTPAGAAAPVFGAEVPLVIAAGREWLQMFIHCTRGKLSVRICHLDKLWHEVGRGMRFGLMGLRFDVPTLAEVGPELLRRIPEAAGWNVVSLRFPSNSQSVTMALAERRLA